MSDLPRPPLITGPFTKWCESVVRYLGMEKLLPGVGYRKKYQGSGGYTLEIVQPPQRSAQPNTFPFQLIPRGGTAWQVRAGFVELRPRFHKPLSNGGSAGFATSVICCLTGDGVYTASDYAVLATGPGDDNTISLDSGPGLYVFYALINEGTAEVGDDWSVTLQVAFQSGATDPLSRGFNYDVLIPGETAYSGSQNLSDNKVLIGFVAIDSNGATTVCQFLYDHLLNRYNNATAVHPVTFQSLSQRMNYRGIWDDADTFGLAGTVFYYGDVVSVHYDETVSIPEQMASFIWLGEPQIINDPPAADFGVLGFRALSLVFKPE